MLQDPETPFSPEYQLLFIIVFIAVAACVFSTAAVALMVYWNCLIVGFYGLPEMGFIHALGVAVLTSFARVPEAVSRRLGGNRLKK